MKNENCMGTSFGTRSDSHTPYYFEFALLNETDTMSHCYFHSTVAEFDMTHQENFNKELLCIRVEEER